MNKTPNVGDRIVSPYTTHKQNEMGTVLAFDPATMLLTVHWDSLDEVVAFTVENEDGFEFRAPA